MCSMLLFLLLQCYVYILCCMFDQAFISILIQLNSFLWKRVLDESGQCKLQYTYSLPYVIIENKTAYEGHWKLSHLLSLQYFNHLYQYSEVVLTSCLKLSLSLC